MTVADPTASGVPYPVVTVGPLPPTSLDQFVGETAFTVLKSGTPSRVEGIGARSGETVRFQEKATPGGKDVRVWELLEHDGEFVAATI